MKILKSGEMAKLLGISIKTLQRWDNEGSLPATRTPKGHRYYTYDQYLEYTGQSVSKPDENMSYVWSHPS